jgi:serine-type D-Ala-D-Ala carboxypeptidase/endopeptidase (penicillin-binding protein 4)
LSYAARVSALSLNENVVWIAATPNKSGAPATVALEPASTTIPLSGSIRTVGGGGSRFTARRTADGGIEVRGTIGAKAGTRRVGLIVDDPALFTTGAFRAALEAEGIAVQGSTRVGATPTTARKVGSIQSPTLDRIVSAMNRESINHFAELLFRNAARGKDHTQQGTVANALIKLREFMLSKAGAPETSVSVADGSGLSTLDRVTPRSMVDLLAYAHRASWGPTFHASLPVAGESELLRRRMKSTSAQGNLHAKTGTTNEVISLGGYVTAQNGEILAFSFIYNGTDRWNAKSTIDVMGETLAAFTR